MADMASKQQTTALFLSTTVTRTGRHTELTKKTDEPDGKPVLCQRTSSSVFRAVSFYTVKLYSLTQSVWGPLEHGVLHTRTQYLLQNLNFPYARNQQSTNIEK